MESNFLSQLRKELNKKETENGSVAYLSSLNDNLDYFMYSSLMNYSYNEGYNAYLESEVVGLFRNAMLEDETTAIKNLLYKLDIRGGQGLRRAFKASFAELIKLNVEKSNKYDKYIKMILDVIGELGRYDYLLVALHTDYEPYVMNKIYNILNNDLTSMNKGDNISLLAKWLPSHRIGKKNNPVAKHIIKYISKHIDISFDERVYRTTLSKLRSYIDIVEKRLSESNPEINFNNVCSKAQLKYSSVFHSKYSDSYKKYIDLLKDGKLKSKSNNLFMNEIVGRVYGNNNLEPHEIDLYNSMWRDQDFNIEGMDKNVLPIVDTSGSMEGRPIECSLSLGILLAERNKGVFKNHFITFSSRPNLVEIKGETLYDKLKSFKTINDNTDINKVFGLLLKIYKDGKVEKDSMPSHLVIISDMEFDEADQGSTNFESWKKKFSDNGLVLPKIVFWNVSERYGTFPVTKDDENVAMISGYSKNVFNNILNIEELNPVKSMLEILSKYDKYIV